MKNKSDNKVFTVVRQKGSAPKAIRPKPNSSCFGSSQNPPFNKEQPKNLPSLKSKQRSTTRAKSIAERIRDMLDDENAQNLVTIAPHQFKTLTDAKIFLRKADAIRKKSDERKKPPVHLNLSKPEKVPNVRVLSDGSICLLNELTGKGDSKRDA